MTTLVLVAGAAILAYFSVLIGMSMDTERQQVAARRIAAQRRALWEERRAVQERRRADEPVLVGERSR